MSAIAGALEQRLGSLSLPLAVILPGGRRIGRKDAAVTLRLNDLSPLGHLVTGEVGKVGQDYVEGKLDLDGGMRELMAAAAELMPGDPTQPASVPPAPLGWVRQAKLMARSRLRHRPETDAEQIQFHYDVSDDFYALWLDPKRVYSCAYFRDGAMSLAEAQEAKLEHICTKLMLKQGDRFLDIGAGWGGLLMFAAEHYGVRAQGITLSKNQHAHVNKLIAERGLAGRVRMDLLDYRHLDESEPYDKIASIGMFEHVGRAQLGELLRQDPAPAQAGRPAPEPRHHRRRHAQPPARLGPRRLHREVHLPRRRARARRARARADQRRRPRGGRRREPEAALREDALGLERRARGPARNGAHAHHRHGAARLSPLPGGQRDVLRARLALALPDAVHAAHRRPRGRADARRTIGLSVQPRLHVPQR